MTIEDVAVHAGVSVATVSRALRGLPNVADSTRRRVHDAAERLTYRPDPAAARLAAGTTGTVSVVVPALDGWYFSNVVAGAEAVAADEGLEFQVIGVASPADRDRLLAGARRLERRTDGVVLVDLAIGAEQVASLVARGIAIATVGTRIDGHPWVGIDDRLVGRLAADHLVGLGHRHVGMIGGSSPDPMSGEVPRARRAGFESALAEHGLALDAADVADGVFTMEGGREAMERLLTSSDRPTAIFSMSDEMAFGALMACRDHGLEPGSDVSLIGVDDHEFSQVVDLTTVGQDVAEHGARAARALIDAMSRTTSGGDRARSASPAPDEAPEERFVGDVGLVLRSTTGPPRPGSADR
ncbi:LacI family DNA-binding transcriptional regulator [Ilumatobacter sp.]|uniref:LacI family DNA-binding transcriptional regulator n=1 Tax=Ilumatobacter sp. TaxID=1967498 RepID=UPI003B52DF14